MASLLLVSRAGANGRFPQASQVIFDPTSPSHLVINTTFGLLESRDGGRTFDWTCEAALGLGGDVDPVVAIPASGRLVVATFIGILTTADGCSFGAPPELQDENVPDITWSRAAPRRLLGFRMLGRGGGQYDAQLVRSDDDGNSWARLEPHLPPDIWPLTIDAASSDPDRVYLTGRLGSADDFASVLLRSYDGGVSFTQSAIPETSGQRLAYIAGVHPSVADRLYVRVDDPAGTVVLMSEDGGLTFRKLWTATGRLFGFAISPDGARMALGGPGDGLWIAQTDGANFARRSDVEPTCLGWTLEGLYACASAGQAGFSIGRSRDSGSTFESLLNFSALCGPRACAADSPVARLCTTEWESIRPTLGTACRLLDGGAIGSSSAADSGPVVRATGGCAFAGLIPSNDRACSAVAIFIALGALVRPRRRRSFPFPTNAGPLRQRSRADKLGGVCTTPRP